MEEIKSKSLWKNKAYVTLLSGQVVSALGSNVTSFAAPLLILFLTNSPAQAGLMYTVITLPTFLFGLPAGVLIDRWDRKKVMIICDIGRMLAMVSIPLAAFLGHLSVPLIFVVLFVGGTLDVFFGVAQTAAVLNVVDKEQLSSALAQGDATLSIASIIGPSLGGALYTISRTIPFLIDSLSYAVSVISLLFIKISFQKEKEESEKKFIHEMKEGLVYLWKEPIIRFLAFITGGGAVAGIAQNLIALLLAKHLGANAVQIGLIFSLGAIGGLLGTGVATKAQKLFPLRTTILTGRWIFAATFFAYFLAFHYLVLAIIFFVYACFSPIYGNALATYRISHVSDDLQGRVTSVYRLILYTGLAIGGALGGLLIQLTGLQVTLIIFAIYMTILALIATLNKDLGRAEKITITS